MDFFRQSLSSGMELWDLIINFIYSIIYKNEDKLIEEYKQNKDVKSYKEIIQKVFSFGFVFLISLIGSNEYYEFLPVTIKNSVVVQLMEEFFRERIGEVNRWKEYFNQIVVKSFNELPEPLKTDPLFWMRGILDKLGVGNLTLAQKLGLNRIVGGISETIIKSAEGKDLFFDAVDKDKLKDLDGWSSKIIQRLEAKNKDIWSNAETGFLDLLKTATSLNNIEGGSLNDNFPRKDGKDYSKEIERSARVDEKLVTEYFGKLKKE